MAIREDILTDVASEVWLESFQLSARDDLKLAGSDDWALAKRTLQGGMSANVDVVTVNNGVLSVEVLPTRGMGLWKGKFRGRKLGWSSPVRHPVHPSLVNLTEQGGTGFLTGFNEWMCRCGLGSFGAPTSGVSGNAGADAETRPTTLHGRIANLPASFVSTKVDTAGPGELTVRGIVEEAALFGGCLRLESELVTTAGSTTLEISDAIVNCSDMPAEAQLLYHINFGPPLLEKGSRVFATTSEVAPYDEHSGGHSGEWDVCGGPTPGYVQQCFFIKPVTDREGRASAVLANAARDFAVQIVFDTEHLPCLTLWKYFAGERDGYVVGIEPGTSYPNAQAVERQLGRVPQLVPGGSLRTSVSLSFYDDRQAVADVIAATIERQSAASLRVHATRQPGFSFPAK